jgi:hypothetical protein
MLFVKYLLLSAGIAMFVIAAAILASDAYLFVAYRRRLLRPAEGVTPGATPAAAPGPEPVVRWRTPVALVMLAWAPPGRLASASAKPAAPWPELSIPVSILLCPWWSTSNCSTHAISCSRPA